MAACMEYYGLFFGLLHLRCGDTKLYR
jgi:hypothetical protein